MLRGSRWIQRWAAVLPAGAMVITVAAPVHAATPAAAALAAGPTGVGAKSAYLFDRTTGRTRWTRGADVKRPIGSINKVMTAVVVLQRNDLDRVVKVKQKYIDYAVRHGGSMAKLRAGDRLTVRQLLYGLMLPSGCDAAYALADVYGPGWRPFVKKMNKTAKQLGMTNTSFANFDGLPWSKAYNGHSTARDVVKLGHKAMKYSAFRKIVGTKTYSLSKTGKRHSYRWVNTNRLLGSYRGMNGVKTGYTGAAGYSFLFTATRSGRTMLGVVLNSSTTTETARFTDAAKVLNWGFGSSTATVTPVPPVPAGANIG